MDGSQDRVTTLRRLSSRIHSGIRLKLEERLIKSWYTELEESYQILQDSDGSDCSQQVDGTSCTPAFKVKYPYASAKLAYNQWIVECASRDLNGLHKKLEGYISKIASVENIHSKQFYATKLETTLGDILNIRMGCDDCPDGDWTLVIASIGELLEKGERVLEEIRGAPKDVNGACLVDCNISSRVKKTPHQTSVTVPIPSLSSGKESLPSIVLPPTSEAAARESVVITQSSMVSALSPQSVAVSGSTVILQENSVSDFDGDCLTADVVHGDEGSADRGTVTGADNCGSRMDLPLPSVCDEKLVSTEVSNPVIQIVQENHVSESTVLGSQFVQPERSSLQIIQDTPVCSVSVSLQILPPANVCQQIVSQSRLADMYLSLSETQFVSSCDSQVSGCPEDTSSSSSFFPTVNKLLKNKHSTAGRIPSMMEKFLLHAGESVVYRLSSRSSMYRSQCHTAPSVELDEYHIGFSPHSIDIIRVRGDATLNRSPSNTGLIYKYKF